MAIKHRENGQSVTRANIGGGGSSVTVEDTLRSTSTTNALSANQGNVIAKDLVEHILTDNTNTTGEILTVGTHFLNSSGQLCKVTTDIPVNGAVTLNTNCEAVNVGGELRELNGKTTREYVEYTANNESFSSALDHLYALIDENKLTVDSLIYIVGSLIACTSQINISLLRYSATQISNGKLYCYEFLLRSSGSQWLNIEGSNYHDFSTEVVNQTLRLYY